MYVYIYIYTDYSKPHERGAVKYKRHSGDRVYIYIHIYMCKYRLLTHTRTRCS